MIWQCTECLRILPHQITFERVHFDAVRGVSEACDQSVEIYSAGANERSNNEMRKIYSFFFSINRHQ